MVLFDGRGGKVGHVRHRETQKNNIMDFERSNRMETKSQIACYLCSRLYTVMEEMPSSQRAKKKVSASHLY